MKSRRFSRRPRPTVTWFRQGLFGQNLTTATQANFTLFAASGFETGVVDELYTILRVKLEVEISCAISALSGVQLLSFGVYRDNVAVLSNPSLAAAADQRQDWMLLDSMLPQAPLSGVTGTTSWSRSFDIKAKRKIDQEAQLLLTLLPVFTCTSVSFSVRSSVLFQRTQRR